MSKDKLSTETRITSLEKEEMVMRIRIRNTEVFCLLHDPHTKALCRTEPYPQGNKLDAATA